MNQPQEGPAEVPANLRLRYWLDFVKNKHRREMELLLGEAKLGKKPRQTDNGWEGWNNVIKHQAGEAAAMRIVGEALGLPEEQILRQENFAFIHDAEKHLDVFQAKRAAGKDMSAMPASETFTPEEEAAMQEKFKARREELDPDGSLATATNEAFFYKVFEETPGKDMDEKLRNLTQAELLQYYIDGIFTDGNIVPPLQRIANTEARRQDLNEDAERTRRLGMKYWDAERLVCVKVEAMIAAWLEQKGVRLPAGGVPAFIQAELAKRMLAGA